MRHKINFLSNLLFIILAIVVNGCSGEDSSNTEATVEARVQATLTAISAIDATVEARIQATVMADEMPSALETSIPVSTNISTPTPSTPTPIPSTALPVHDSLSFAGYEWRVKSSEDLVGPGPNFFSNRKEDVFVDDNGRLHLRIVNRDGQWYATEVINTESLGYGLYTFHLDTQVDQLDPNVVLGLFTWDDNAPEENYREIDIEFSRWGQSEDENAQYVIQPWEKTTNIHRFNVELDSPTSTHSFFWHPNGVLFQSSHGHHSTASDPADIQSWFYQGDDIPSPGEENVRINLWLRGGEAPINGQDSEVIITNFSFTPWDSLAALEAPNNVRVDTKSTNSLKISWDQLPNASSYSIFRSDRYDGEYDLIQTVDTNVFIDEGLTQNQLFFYKIVAEELFSISEPSLIAWGVPTDTSQNALFVQFDGNYVTGKVIHNALSSTHRIVWWVKTDTWYIQPWLDDYYTEINADGTFREWGHQGSRARIYLVEEGYLTPILQVEVDKT